MNTVKVYNGQAVPIHIATGMGRKLQILPEHIIYLTKMCSLSLRIVHMCVENYMCYSNSTVELKSDDS